jgi:hypothetical protein
MLARRLIALLLLLAIVGLSRIEPARPQLLLTGVGTVTAHATTTLVALPAAGQGALGQTSTDAVTWTQQTTASAKTWAGLAYGGSSPVFCAVSNTGTSPAAMSSPDGVAWTSQTASSTSTPWEAIAWSPSLALFAAVGAPGTTAAAMTSPDCTTWTARTATGIQNWVSVAWSPTLALFTTVATNGNGVNAASWSSDGINWNVSSAAPANATWRSVAWGSVFCAVGSDISTASAMSSADGKSWTVRTTPSQSSSAIAWSPALSLFAALGNNTAMSSPDCVTWTSRTPPANQQWVNIVWSAKLALFVAVSSTAGGTTSVATSPDGAAWTLRTTPFQALNSIATAGFLLRRDLDPAANDNSPMWLSEAA